MVVVNLLPLLPDENILRSEEHARQGWRDGEVTGWSTQAGMEGWIGVQIY